MKKIIALLLVIALTAALSVSLTMAYLQDSDDDVNVMTLGNVKIEQHEYERQVDADGNFVTYTETERDGDPTGYKLTGFTQAKPLYPATGAVTGWDSTKVYFAQLPDDSALGAMDILDGINNVQDKFVFVENTGKSDAYVRTIIAYEVGTKTDAFGDLIMLNVNVFWKSNDIGVVAIDGNNYYVVEYVYDGNQYPEGGTMVESANGKHPDGIVHPGEYTYCSLAQVYMTSKANNEDVKAIDGNNNGTYDILVLSQAVQVEGFDNAEEALDAAFGDITTDNHPWTEDVVKNFPQVADTSDELIEALETGKNVILTDDVKIDPANMSNAYGKTGINVKNGQTIDGGGNILDIKGAGGTWDSGINTTGGLIKDITVTGSFRGIFINHNSDHSERVVLENVIIDGTTYTISCDQGTYQGLTATNSTFMGWTSYAKSLGDAKFIDCYFGYGNDYSFCRPYAPTEFVGCDFEAGFEMDCRAAVTFENCTIDGNPLTAENLSTLVTSNIANATVK